MGFESALVRFLSSHFYPTRINRIDKGSNGEWSKISFVRFLPSFVCKLPLPFGGPFLTGFILPVSLPTPKLMLTENDAKSLEFSARCVYFGWSPKCWNAFRIKKMYFRHHNSWSSLGHMHGLSTVFSEEGCRPDETQCSPLKSFLYI